VGIRSLLYRVHPWKSNPLRRKSSPKSRLSQIHETCVPSRLIRISRSPLAHWERRAESNGRSASKAPGASVHTARMLDLVLEHHADGTLPAAHWEPARSLMPPSSTHKVGASKEPGAVRGCGSFSRSVLEGFVALPDEGVDAPGCTCRRRREEERGGLSSTVIRPSRQELELAAHDEWCG
jgi:hypothetical protein